VERNGQFYTPPVVCGLLPGTYRAWLLAQRRVCERVLTRSDLRAAERIWLVNSVRGARAVQFRPPSLEDSAFMALCPAGDLPLSLFAISPRFVILCP
jgi:branched-subunit amino acid aminotransferase/4-amino-4-deoxychorismate lyase